MATFHEVLQTIDEAFYKIKETFRDDSDEVNQDLYEEPVKPFADFIKQDPLRTTGNILKKSITIQWLYTTQLWVVSFHKLIPVGIIEYGLSNVNNNIQFHALKAKTFLATKNIEDSDFIMQKLDEVQVQYLGRFNV